MLMAVFELPKAFTKFVILTCGPPLSHYDADVLYIEFFSPPRRSDRLWGPSNLVSNCYRGSFPRGWSGRSVKLTTHFYLVPRLRIHGPITPLLRYVFMAWCLVKHRDNFTFTLSIRWGAGIVQWYSAGLRAESLGVRVPAGAGNFALYHHVHTGSGAQTAYLMGSRSSFPEDKVAGA
jgi:hypothetical protein